MTGKLIKLSVTSNKNCFGLSQLVGVVRGRWCDRQMVVRKAVLFALMLILQAFLAGLAYAGDAYQKKAYFDPPEAGDQVYKADPDLGWSKDQACILCHIDRKPNPPYKEWDYFDKYGLNTNGRIFRDSNYQRLFVPGISGLATYLPKQSIKVKVKVDEGSAPAGRGVVDKDGKYYRMQWAELEKDGTPAMWSLTPGFPMFKEFKFKELWIKYDPATGKGEHFARLDLAGEREEIVNGKKEKREVKFTGQLVGTNSGPGGRTMKGLVWTTGLEGKKSNPDDYYYDTTYNVNKTLKTFIAEYEVEMELPWVTDDPEMGLIVTPGNKGNLVISNATWSVEYRKRWNGTSIHAIFADDTMKCAACHSTHRSSGDKLIGRKTETALCTLCHDGTGSVYNVTGGMISNRFPSPAGPLDKLIRPIQPGAREAEEIKATSKHEMKYTTLISAAPGGSSTWSGELKCSSCHNPHGSSNYRFLRVTPNPNNWDKYGGGNRIEVKAQIAYAGGKVGTAETVNYKTGMTEFCSGCHVDYQAGAGSGSQMYEGNPAYGNAVQEKALMSSRRHAMYVDGNDNPKYVFNGTESITALGITYPLVFETEQKVPEAFGGGQKDKPAIACQTCHFGHGTTVPEENSEAQTIGGNKDWYKKGIGRTMLLRAPGRGVCMACHKSSLMERP